MRHKKLISLLAVFLLLLSLCIVYATNRTPATTTPSSDSTQETTVPIATDVAANAGGVLLSRDSNPAGELTVSYIDVGQADSILIQQGTAAMLIDAGNNADADLVVSFLESKGITQLDYVIGTHPHEDHIGGLDAVIESFEIGKVILPDAINTTKTFEDVLRSIQTKGLKITKAIPGTHYTLDQASVSILGPALSTYDDLNDASVVCRIVFGTTSFLFTGDAEEASERAMVQNGYALHADVLKIGHHGSTSSSSGAFLDAVSPRYAVICVGADNTYGHPADSTLNALGERDIHVYRTDLDGTITAVSDGSGIVFSQEVSR